MADFKVITPKRDIARELARKYSTMTHDELDVVEDILEPIKYGKGEMILPEGEASVVVQLNVDNFEKVIVADKEESVSTDNAITSGTMGASTVINGELSSGLPF